MKRAALLFGPDGQFFRENSPEFLAALGDHTADYDAGRFAVANLGFVRLVLEHPAAEITAHGQAVAPTALVAMQSLLPWAHLAAVHLHLLGSPGFAGVMPARLALIRLSGLLRHPRPGNRLS